MCCKSLKDLFSKLAQFRLKLSCSATDKPRSLRKHGHATQSELGACARCKVGALPNLGLIRHTHAGLVAALVSPWLAVSPTRQDASSMQPIDLLAAPLTGGAWADRSSSRPKQRWLRHVATPAKALASEHLIRLDGADVDEWSSVNESTVFNSTVSGAVILKSMVQGNSHIWADPW